MSAASPVIPPADAPDPRRGVFETILIFEDRPIELDAHLERLAASVRQLYGAEPPECRERVLTNARGGGIGRLRLDLAPQANGELSASVIVAGVDPADVFPGPELAVALKTMQVTAGLGDHKWADRERLVRAEALCKPRVVPLLVGPDGAVYEGSRGNVFAIVGGALVTPPLDGAILPGIARARTIEIARQTGIEVEERALSLAELSTAEGAFLTGSIRGIEPVRAVDGVELPIDSEATRRVSSGLREVWLAPSGAAAGWA